MTASPTQMLSNEMWLCSRLHDMRAAIFDGLTTTAERCARARKLILDKALADKKIGSDKAGRPVTYAAYFYQVYGENL